MPNVPSESAHLLSAVCNPVRLPILLALEERPRSSADLARDLGLPYDSVNYAVKAMAKAGLVEVVSEGVTRTNLMHRVYAVNYSGWSALVTALGAIVATRRPRGDAV
jgi:predicted transcriptional regulator